MRRLCLTLLLSALLLSGGTGKAMACTADNVAWVAGGGECLAIRTVPPANPAPGPTLLVLVHGDVGGPLEKMAEALRDRLPPLRSGNVVTVVLTRPGFADSAGRYSSGLSDTLWVASSYNAHNTQAVAEAIAALKSHYGARRVVALGASGGAAILANGLGLRPELAPDAVLLAACPCNLPDYWRHRNLPAVPSLSPHTLVDRVPGHVAVMAITGSDDTNTPPALGQAYVDSLRARGVRASFEIVAGATHETILANPAVVKTLARLLAGDGVPPGAPMARGAAQGGPGGRPDADSLFDNLDGDGDGRIARTEWRRSPIQFQRLDRDGDGFLTRDELQAAGLR